MPGGNDIRKTFVDYFAANGHTHVPSSPLVPHQDPTLMFTNAGMVQFKNVFTGQEKRDYSRAVTSQKCVRAGGKHNDLDNVGYTARHHTFFEMLGNFSFGDYFKDRAIELAWNLVTKEFGLPEEKLLVTVYSEDDQAFDLWKKIAGLPESRIIRIPTSDNFWSMGDTGPCGPCSEIFYDHGDHIPGGPPGSPDEDGDRFIEIWNLVFMQFEQRSPDDRVDLPRPSIDTGMGLERITATLNGTHDNYATDLLRRLIEQSAHVSNTDPDGPGAAHHRVIADHLRASSFLIADGVLPSNEGRGYVLRRIMRRGMRHAHMLGCQDPMMYRLVPELVSMMGGTFEELVRAEALISETLKLEEGRFKQTLERGLKLLEDETGKLGEKEPLAGEVAFRLYDTFGFPLDLTQDILRNQGRGVDTDGFDTAMARQRAEARKNWAGSGEKATEAVWFDVREQAGASEFLGYTSDTAEAVVRAVLVDGVPVDRAEPGCEVQVVLNQTPFYGESGGQMGDIGTIRSEKGAVVTVTDTQKRAGDVHVHFGTLDGGPLSIGEVVSAGIDRSYRDRLRANHSATHLLHRALRIRLGDHVVQKGSLVSPERLRFDISHPKPMAPEELAAVEADVNGMIRGNGEVSTRLMAPEEAVKAGALALFGEKYGDEVRVVSMGGIMDPNWSTELCGGTHVRRTGDIGAFHIVSEGAVAAGVRRIEALTGQAAIDHLSAQEEALRQVAGALKTTPQEAAARVAQLVEERRKLEKELAEARKKAAMGGAAAAGPAAREINGIRFVGQVADGVPPKQLKGMIDEMRGAGGPGVYALVGVNDGKAALVVGVSEELLDRTNAVDLVRAGVGAIGGKGGGGRPDMAQGGGPDGAQAAEAIAAVEAALAG
ncbi:MAG: alanine--tRNA ligase [Minwuia sp.]|uniref:alanine--tRNA ligase n=1 Tax=Minwuia sp. TaxID=2493630 RepID=UPI003A8BD815